MPAPMQHAGSASGERSDAPPLREAPVPSDLDRLKDILLGDELGALDALDARVGETERKQESLPARLPLAIERADSERMASALAQPVTQALGAAVRENRQIIVDVLFPVIGPAIRKAIAEALRTLVADVNGAIESSFTPRGLRWRIEAWRSGVPYATIVLKYTLNYGIDHVFLIERGSGLVLDRESAPHLPELDADAIAGMLTAIGEFVRDSVGRDGGSTLESARVGDHLLWVLAGPRANLACFIHGVPPAGLHAVLERRLEAIHARFDGAGDAAIDAATRESLSPEALMREAGASEQSPARASPWPMRIVFLTALALIAWMFVRYERGSAALENLRARLNAHPGFVLTGIDRRGGALTAHGLLDPDAEPLKESLGDAAPPLQFDTVGYVSTDDAIIARRARRLLDAPPSVTIAVAGGALALGGRADPGWIEVARERAAWVPGVRRVDFAVVADTDEGAQARALLDQIVRALAERRVAFLRGTEPVPDGGTVVDAIAADARRASAIAAMAHVSIAWTATGTNDDPGSDSINTQVRADRARWLAGALAARGIPDVRTAADDDAQATQVRQRSAFLRAVVAESRP